jgi:endogenous inhibitor of DNA gyrase (YacG/DUF329 family)
MDEETIEVLCEHCGQTFTAFLKQMAEKNAEATCPCCGKSGGKGPSSVMPPAAQS